MGARGDLLALAVGRTYLEQLATRLPSSSLGTGKNHQKSPLNQSLVLGRRPVLSLRLAG